MQQSAARMNPLPVPAALVRVVSGGKPMTLPAKVDLIRRELGISGDVPLGKVVSEANNTLELVASGPLLRQVHTIMSVLGVGDQPVTVAGQPVLGEPPVPTVQSDIEIATVNAVVVEPIVAPLPTAPERAAAPPTPTPPPQSRARSPLSNHSNNNNLWEQCEAAGDVCKDQDAVAAAVRSMRNCNPNFANDDKGDYNGGGSILNIVLCWPVCVPICLPFMVTHRNFFSWALRFFFGLLVCIYGLFMFSGLAGSVPHPLSWSTAVMQRAGAEDHATDPGRLYICAPLMFLIGVAVYVWAAYALMSDKEKPLHTAAQVHACDLLVSPCISLYQLRRLSPPHLDTISCLRREVGTRCAAR